MNIPCVHTGKTRSKNLWGGYHHDSAAYICSSFSTELQNKLLLLLLCASIVSLPWICESKHHDTLAFSEQQLDDVALKESQNVIITPEPFALVW